MIAALRARMPAGTLTSVGIGDDSAVVTAPSGSVVAAVDMVIEGRHFRREWSSAYDVGVKAAARSLADIAAMGAVNTALLVALAAPGTLPARWAVELAEGLAHEATRAGAGIVGGDTARADAITLSVTALGDLENRRPVLRSGARPGDLIAVAGPLGHAAAGLALLATGAVGPAAMTDADTAGRAHSTGATSADRVAARDRGLGAGQVPAVLSELVAAQLRPAPPYQAGPEAARLGATAMIDVSDGLLADLGHVAAASGVHVNVNSSRLAPAAALRVAAASLPAPAARGPFPSSRTSSAYSSPPTPREDSRPLPRAVPSPEDSSPGERLPVASQRGSRAAASPGDSPTAIPPAGSRAASARTADRPGGSRPAGLRYSPRAVETPNSPPAATEHRDFAAMALEWVLTGGEDHSLVATFPAGTVLPDRWHVIGEVLRGAGVTVDGAPHDGPPGWQHFR